MTLVLAVVFVWVVGLAATLSLLAIAKYADEASSTGGFGRRLVLCDDGDAPPRRCDLRLGR